MNTSEIKWWNDSIGTFLFCRSCFCQHERKWRQSINSVARLKSFLFRKLLHCLRCRSANRTWVNCCVMLVILHQANIWNSLSLKYTSSHQQITSTPYGLRFHFQEALTHNELCGLADLSSRCCHTPSVQMDAPKPDARKPGSQKRQHDWRACRPVTRLLIATCWRVQMNTRPETNACWDTCKCRNEAMEVHYGIFANCHLVWWKQHTVYYN